MRRGHRPPNVTETDTGGRQRDLADLQTMLSGKWAVSVLRALEAGPAGFGDLREAVGGAPEKSLARRLNELRCHGLVRREHAPTSPPRPRYRLTAEGRRLAAALRAVARDLERVDCAECADDCRVPTVNPDATRAAMADGC
jgi:DNA-binding HxlR family transcriptional regulator